MITAWTIGHSTRPIGEFIQMLKSFAIESLIDIRTIPRSRYNPQFNSDALKNSLEQEKISYLHRKGLGGLRKPHIHSTNLGWRNSSFRGYADYMQTEAFVQQGTWLIQAAQETKTVIMCAEAVPWRCHRSLVADWLVSRDVRVEHIMDESKSFSHELSSMAKVNDRILVYPKQEIPSSKTKPSRKKKNDGQKNLFEETE